MSGESNLEIVVSKRPRASGIQGELGMRHKNEKHSRKLQIQDEHIRNSTLEVRIDPGA